MKNYILLVFLGLLTMTCAVLEGLIDGLSPQFVQFTGFLTIIFAGVFVGWTLKLQTGEH